MQFHESGRFGSSACIELGAVLSKNQDLILLPAYCTDVFRPDTACCLPELRRGEDAVAQKAAICRVRRRLLAADGQRSCLRLSGGTESSRLWGFRPFEDANCCELSFVVNVKSPLFRLNLASIRVMEGPKKVELKWKECSRTFQEIKRILSEDEDATFDLSKPSISAWVQNVLKEATCGDLERSVCAFWRFVNIFSKLVLEQGQDKAAETASYLLQRGFGKELHAGLKDARLSGEWFLLPKPIRSGADFFINRVEVYASVLGVIVDERTAKFFLKEMDHLLKLLEGLFIQAAHPSLAKLTQQYDRDSAADARRAIVAATSSLCAWSGKAKRFMINRKGLNLEMVREVAEVFRSGELIEADDTSRVTMINSGLLLMSNLNSD